jgi:hypothetical protein
MSERPESVSRDISKILCLETSAEQRSVIRHTIDGFIAGDPHHRTGAIGLFAELDTALDQPSSYSFVRIALLIQHGAT